MKDHEASNAVLNANATAKRAALKLNGMTVQAGAKAVWAKLTPTPGPWHWNGNQTVTVGSGAYMIAATGTYGEYNRPEFERKANAALIAAAPDMLAALETCLNHVMHYASMPQAHSDAHRDAAIARAALAKAKGGAV